MNKELVDAFYQLDINNKREKISRELNVIADYLRIIEGKLGLDNNADIYEYNPAVDYTMDEEDHLTSLFQDVFNVERELITIDKLLDLK